MKQLWNCIACGRRGYVNHASSAGAMEVIQAILDDHQRLSPACARGMDEWAWARENIQTPKEAMFAPEPHVHCVHCSRACEGPLRCVYCQIDIEQGRQPGVGPEPYCPGVSEGP